MYDVQIPCGELNEFDLPPVCALTGRTEGVVFKKVKFSWYPRWVGLLVVINPLIAMIVATVLTRRVNGAMPFTEEAWSRWRRGQLLFGLSLATCVLTIVGAIGIMASGHVELGFATVALAIAQPVLAWRFFLKGKSPVVKKIDRTHLTLSLPSADAVAALQSHLVAGRARQPPRDGQPLPVRRAS
jgi:hypothetical protein